MVSVVKEKKYAYIQYLLILIFYEYCFGRVNLRRGRQLPEGDIRREQHTVASVPPPPTADIAKKHLSRYAKEESGTNC